jgi:hypothetical protein
MVKVTVEDMMRNVAFQSNQALLTFVSLDENKRTRQVCDDVTYGKQCFSMFGLIIYEFSYPPTRYPVSS